MLPLKNTSDRASPKSGADRYMLVDTLRGIARLSQTAYWAILILGILMVGSLGRQVMAREFLVVGLTSALLYWAGKTGRIFTWTLGRPAQFLGRISYSLYLIHTLTGTRAISFAKTRLGNDLTFPGVVCALLLGLSVTLAASYLFYLAIEAPAHRLSRRIRLGISDTRPASDTALPG